MAELFLCRASSIHGFEKLCVLKRILPQHAESEDFIRMFLAEARLAANLHHPNIVQVFDIGEEAGSYFFTMEYVQGQDLRRLVRAARKKQRPIPLEHILHIIMGVAAGLNHAHEKAGMDGQPLGIVHRDVSPSNVLVTYEGDVKIVDFGIAKAATAQVATIAGTLKGKIPYMSPEQCRGESVDRRSDIFSIGTLLWELTTGKRLFAGENEFAILSRVAKGDVPQPSSIRPDYPHELESIVMRALQADPDQRYSSAVDLQLDLEDFSREARLPVSSARMARFMRDLFESDIQAAREELNREEHPHIDPSASISMPGSSPQSSLLHANATVDNSSSSEFTPSELRNYARATAAPAASDDVSYSGFGTDVGDAPLDRVPARVSLGAALGVGMGLIAAGVLGLGTWYKLQSEPQKSSPLPKTTVQFVASETPPDPDDAQYQVESNDAVMLGDGTGAAAEEEPVEASYLLGIPYPPVQPIVDTPVADVGDDEDDEDAVAPDDDADKTSKSRRTNRPHRKAKRPSRPPPQPKTVKKPKPKWDRDEPLPPGL
jgi:serine/threonine protein kinase